MFNLSESGLIHVSPGDKVAFEVKDGRTKWRWSLGVVVSQPVPRLTEIELWKRKEKVLSEQEAAKSAELKEAMAKQRSNIEEKKVAAHSRIEALEEKKRSILGAKAKAEAELAEAQSAMVKAREAVEHIQDKDIREMRTYHNAPEMVRSVLEAVAMILDTDSSGRPKRVTWVDARAKLNQSDFLRHVVGYDASRMNQALVDALKKEYTERKNFNAEGAAKASKAIRSLYQWVTVQLKNFSANAESAAIGSVIDRMKEDIAAMEAKGADDVAEIERLQTELDGLEVQHEHLTTDNDDLLEFSSIAAPDVMSASTLGHHKVSEWVPAGERITILTTSILSIVEKEEVEEGFDALGTKSMRVSASRVLASARSHLSGSLRAGSGGENSSNNHVTDPMAISMVPANFTLATPPLTAADTPIGTAREREKVLLDATTAGGEGGGKLSSEALSLAFLQAEKEVLENKFEAAETQRKALAEECEKLRSQLAIASVEAFMGGGSGESRPSANGTESPSPNQSPTRRLSHSPKFVDRELLRDAERRIGELEEELMKWQDRALQDRKKDSDANDDISKKLVAVTAKAALFEEKANVLQDNLERIRKERNEALEKVEELEKSTTASQQERAKELEELNKAKKGCDTSSNALEEVRKRLGELEAECNVLKEEKQAAEIDAAGYLGDLEALRDELEAAKTEKNNEALLAADAKAKLGDAKRELGETKTLLNDVKDEVIAKDLELKTLEEKLARLQEQLSESEEKAKKSIDAAEETSRTLLSDATHRLSAAEKKVKELQEEKAKSKTIIDDLRGKLEMGDAQLKDVLSKEEASRMELVSIKTEIAVSNKKFADAESALSAARQELDAEQKRAAESRVSCSEQLTASNKELTSIKASLSQKEDELRFANSSLSTAEKRIADLNSTIEELGKGSDAANQALTSKISKLEADNKASEVAFATLNGKLKEADHKTSSLEKSLEATQEQLKTEASAAAKKIEELTSKAEEAATALSDSAKEKASSDERITSLSEQIESLEKALGDAKRECERASTELAKAQQSEANLKSQVLELGNETDAATAALNALLAEIADTKRAEQEASELKLSKAKSLYTEELSQLQSKLEEKAAKASVSYELRVAELSAKIEELSKGSDAVSEALHQEKISLAAKLDALTESHNHSEADRLALAQKFEEEKKDRELMIATHDQSVRALEEKLGDANKAVHSTREALKAAESQRDKLSKDLVSVNSNHAAELTKERREVALKHKADIEEATEAAKISERARLAAEHQASIERSQRSFDAKLEESEKLMRNEHETNAVERARELAALEVSLTNRLNEEREKSAALEIQVVSLEEEKVSLAVAAEELQSKLNEAIASLPSTNLGDLAGEDEGKCGEDADRSASASKAGKSSQLSHHRGNENQKNVNTSFGSTLSTTPRSAVVERLQNELAEALKRAEEAERTLQDANAARSARSTSASDKGKGKVRVTSDASSETTATNATDKSKTNGGSGGGSNFNLIALAVLTAATLMTSLFVKRRLIIQGNSANGQ